MPCHLLVWKQLQNFVFDPRWCNFDIHCQDGVIRIPSLVFQLLVKLSDFSVEDLVGSDAGTRCLMLPDVSVESLGSSLRLMFQCQDSSVLVLESQQANALFWLSWTKTQTDLEQPHDWIRGILNGLAMEVTHAAEKSMRTSKATSYTFECKVTFLMIGFFSGANLRIAKKQREPEECNICGKSLYDKHSLKKHVDAVHFNIKRFQCQVCQRRFSVKNDLKNHVIAVHEQAKVCFELVILIFRSTNYDQFCNSVF